MLSDSFTRYPFALYHEFEPLNEDLNRLIHAKASSLAAVQI